MIRPEHHKPLPERYSCVLFDMDGTLVDSARGVTASAAEALASVGATVPGPDQLHSLGMPMAVATSKVGDQAIRLTRHFGVDHYFTDVCGASDALVRSRKDAVIAESCGGSAHAASTPRGRSWWATAYTTSRERPHSGCQPFLRSGATASHTNPRTPLLQLRLPVGSYRCSKEPCRIRQRVSSPGCSAPPGRFRRHRPRPAPDPAVAACSGSGGRGF